MGRDKDRTVLYDTKTNVSTHAPAWGATCRPAMTRAGSDCFNPRARMGRDDGLEQTHVGQWVSTHAPAWGATSQAQPAHRADHVSTHAPAWGATWLFPLSGQPRLCFNPRARMGRDVVILSPVNAKLVSTHAPAWGATYKLIDTEHQQQFQPTRPHGARRSTTKRGQR